MLSNLDTRKWPTQLDITAGFKYVISGVHWSCCQWQAAVTSHQHKSIPTHGSRKRDVEVLEHLFSVTLSIVSTVFVPTVYSRQLLLPHVWPWSNNFWQPLPVKPPQSRVEPPDMSNLEVLASEDLSHALWSRYIFYRCHRCYQPCMEVCSALSPS